MAARFLNVQEAADFLGISKSCAYAAIDKGEFPVPVIKIGSRIKVPAAALHALAGAPEVIGSVVDADLRGDFAGDAA